MNDFGLYIKAEIEAMKRFMETESKRLGRELTRNEAAELWVRAKAVDFRQQYNAEREGRHNG